MDNLKTLIGSSTYIDQMDDEEQENRDVESSVNYDENEIINNIGKPEFKSVYLNLTNFDNIKNLSVESQRGFCHKILDKIIEVYEYEFMPLPKLDSQQNINNVYDLIEFLEYDHIDFFASIWAFLDDISKVNLELYCKKNIEKILVEVEDQIDSYDFSELISIFLRTNNKENMIRFVINISENKRMLIKLRIMERKENG